MLIICQVVCLNCIHMSTSYNQWPALRAPPTSPIAESRLILANAMGPSNFPTWLHLCFLGIFSKSFCGNQSQMFRNSFRCCFVCVCLGVHCTHSWKKTKVHLFLDKAIFQQDNHLSSSVPQLHSHVNILKWRCVVSHLLVLSESVAKQLA